MAKARGSPKTGGRKKGSLNKFTEAQQDFISAWQACKGPETAKKLMQAALEEATGKEVTKTYWHKNGDHETETTIVRDFGPLQTLLPYMARKMPQALETTGKDGGPVEILWYDPEKHLDQL